ncbi:MAG: hypothetical protein UW45_C0002G0027 [Parcubacteria group bacterium GW2011_GWC2_44_22]|nr:MAG: hypothetical protein UW45_C0002G0027 [Parcubacteria group bacterium GW2011_GWC2_44_22]
MKFFSAKLKSTTDFYTQIALMLVIVLMVNVIFALAPWRVDLSEAKLYSISPVTKQTLKDLDDVVNIKAYFTEDLPGYLVAVRQQVKDLLAEYQNYGQGKIQIKFINPNDNPLLEQEAAALGLPPLQFNVVKKDKFEVAQGYLGIAILYGDKLETIPVVQDTSNLEYNLTAAIKKVISGQSFTIGILQKADNLAPIESLSLLEKVLGQQYQVRAVDLSGDELIGSDISTLIIPGPYGKFTDRDLYVIDQYIMSGRGVLLAADGVRLGENLQATPNDSNLFDLLKSYGVTVNRDLIYDPRYNGQASFSQGFVQFLTPYGFWPRVLKPGFNQDSVLVNKLESLYLAWGSSLDVTGAAGGQILAKTSPDSQVVKDNFNLSPQEQPQGTTGSGNFPVAVLVKTKLSSYFKTPIPRVQSTEEQTTETRIAEVAASKVVVISDADIVTDDFVRLYQENMIFLQNIVDGLTLDESLAAIRSKAVSSRPIDELDDTARTLVKYGNIVGVPLLVVLMAIVRFFWRRKSQRLGDAEI